MRKFLSPCRLHDNFYGGTYMGVLNVAVASCDLYSIQIFEAAHKCLKNLWLPGWYSFISNHTFALKYSVRLARNKNLVETMWNKDFFFVCDKWKIFIFL